jgi:hypothetical protein
MNEFFITMVIFFVCLILWKIAQYITRNDELVFITCARCKGNGKVPIPLDGTHFWRTCPNCNGDRIFVSVVKKEVKHDQAES